MGGEGEEVGLNLGGADCVVDTDLRVHHDMFSPSRLGGHLPCFVLLFEYLYFLLDETVHRAYVSHVCEVVPLQMVSFHSQNF